MSRHDLVLIFAGWTLPTACLVSFAVENGSDSRLLVSQLIANHISAFIAVGLILTAIILVVLSYGEGERRHIWNRWLNAVATLAVGLSSSLPLFHCSRSGTLNTHTQSLGNIHDDPLWRNLDVGRILRRGLPIRPGGVLSPPRF